MVGPAFNAATTVVVMLETPEAVANADAIAAVPGVDILHVGSTDLCESLGIPGKVADPALERCYAQVVAACRRHGKVAGAGGLAATPDVLRTMLRMGVRFVTAGIEWDFLMAAAQQRANLLRSLPLDVSTPWPTSSCTTSRPRPSPRRSGWRWATRIWPGNRS